MKQTFVLLLNLALLTLVGCKTANIPELNKPINTTNKLGVEKSSFESANSMGRELGRQPEFSDGYANKLA